MFPVTEGLITKCLLYLKSEHLTFQTLFCPLFKWSGHVRDLANPSNYCIHVHNNIWTEILQFGQKYNLKVMLQFEQQETILNICMYCNVIIWKAIFQFGQ